jgi:hypothetical protein
MSDTGGLGLEALPQDVFEVNQRLEAFIKDELSIWESMLESSNDDASLRQQVRNRSKELVRLATSSRIPLLTV